MPRLLSSIVLSLLLCTAADAQVQVTFNLPSLPSGVPDVTTTFYCVGLQQDVTSTDQTDQYITANSVSFTLSPVDELSSIMILGRSDPVTVTVGANSYRVYVRARNYGVYPAGVTNITCPVEWVVWPL